MLTRLIVDLYAWVVETALWLVLIGAALLGFIPGIPMVGSVGSSGTDPMMWKLFSALAPPLIVFLLLIVVVGPFLFLVDIRKSIRALEAANQGSGTNTGLFPLEYQEPILRDR